MLEPRVPPDLMQVALLTHAALLGVGVVVGVPIQYVVTLTLSNGAYARLSARRRLGLVLSGGVGALLAGLLVLATIPHSNPYQIAWKLWLAQASAAVLGAEAVRMIARRVLEGGKGDDSQ